jgi:hypothetical protein
MRDKEQRKAGRPWTARDPGVPWRPGQAEAATERPGHGDVFGRDCAGSSRSRWKRHRDGRFLTKPWRPSPRPAPARSKIALSTFSTLQGGKPRSGVCGTGGSVTLHPSSWRAHHLCDRSRTSRARLPPVPRTAPRRPYALFPVPPAVSATATACPDGPSLARAPASPGRVPSPGRRLPWAATLSTSTGHTPHSRSTPPFPRPRRSFPCRTAFPPDLVALSNTCS